MELKNNFKQIHLASNESWLATNALFLHINELSNYEPYGSFGNNSNSPFIKIINKLLGMVSKSGYYIPTFQSENDGCRSANITPIANNLKSLSPLRGHTDGAFLSFPWETSKESKIPEFIFLFCIINTESVSTNLISLDKIISLLPQTILDELCLPNYIVLPQSSWKIKSNTPYLYKRPLIVCHQGQFFIRYSHSQAFPINEKAFKAKKIMDEIVRLYSEKITLKPGELLIINNRKSIHGRSSLEQNKLDGQRKRWLLRCYAYSNRSDLIFNKDNQLLP